MKILITTDLYSTDTNGVVTSVKNLYNELTAKGHDVRILTLSGNTKSHKDGNVSYIGSMPLWVYPDVRMPTTYRHSLIREIIEWKPDIIHSQCEFFSFQFALRISGKTGAPIVHTYHTMYDMYITYVIPFKRVGQRILRVLTRLRLKRVKTIIVPTRKVENALRDYGIKNDIKVVPSGISLDQHKKRISADERKNKRNVLGITDDKFVMLNLGRLGTEKNIDELIRFYSEAIKSNNELTFLIVGGGPAKEQLEKLAADLGVEKSVIFTGMVRPEEVQTYYQLGDIFVSASTSETQGLTYIEAAANGLPLLCRKDPCLQDIIIDGKNGYAYSDEAAFLKSINLASSDRKWCSEAGKFSEEIAAGFDKSTFGTAIINVYEAASEQKFSEE